MRKHSTMEAVLALTNGITCLSFCLRFSRVCDPIIQTKLSQTHCRLYVCLKVKRTCFGRDWTTLHSNRPQKKKNTIWQAREGIYTFHVLFVTEKHMYIGLRPFCWKNKVALRIFNFLNGHAPPILWPTPAANWHLHCIDLAQASIIPECLSWIDRAWLLYTGFLLVFVRQKCADFFLFNTNLCF